MPPFRFQLVERYAIDRRRSKLTLRDNLKTEVVAGTEKAAERSELANIAIMVRIYGSSGFIVAIKLAELRLRKVPIS